MSFIEVKNKRGTSDRKPTDGSSSWLEFWKTNKARKLLNAGFCSVIKQRLEAMCT